MKLSVSIPEADVEFVDEYAARRGLPSRSAVFQHAVRLLRTEGLGEAYAAAFDEWDEGEDSALWDARSGDGLTDAER